MTNDSRNFDITMAFETHGFKFEPCQDITTYELAKITQMFLVALINKNIDAKWYIEQHKLDRHFTLLR